MIIKSSVILASVLISAEAIAQGAAAYPPGQTATFTTAICLGGVPVCASGVAVMFCEIDGVRFSPRDDGTCYAADKPIINKPLLWPQRAR